MFCKLSLNCWLFLKHNDETHAHSPRLSAHRMKTWPVTWLYKSFKSVLHFAMSTSHGSAISNKERKNEALPCTLKLMWGNSIHRKGIQPSRRVKHIREWHKNKGSIKELKDDYCPKRATLPYWPIVIVHPSSMQTFETTRKSAPIYHSFGWNACVGWYGL